jgi:hypothetical protein
MSLRPAWIPGCDLPYQEELVGKLPVPPGTAFGGNVYSQAAFVACKALEEELGASGMGAAGFGLHVSHLPVRGSMHDRYVACSRRHVLAQGVFVIRISFSIKHIHYC